MSAERRRAVVRGVGLVLFAVGLLATAWFVYSDIFGGRFAVLCTDPEDRVCSGHYVHGVVNEVWSIAVAALGALGLLTSRYRSQHAAAA